ncbi:MAG: phage major tail tube protein [Christensenellales bacterium]
MQKPVGTIDYRVYEDGNNYRGIASVKMPEVVNKTFQVNGAGIAGDLDVPVLGHTEAMTMDIDFVDNPRSAAILSQQRIHTLVLMSAHETLDDAAGALSISSHKYIVKVMPKSFSGGTLAAASQQGVATSFICLYLEEYIDGVLIRKIDKLNSIFEDGSGDDILEPVRRALGEPANGQI